MTMLDDWGDRDRRWTGISSRTLDVDGRQVPALWCDGRGVPQLLVHGLGGSKTNWLEVMADLSHDGPVLAVDLPGFGANEPGDVADVRLGRQRRFLGRLLDTLGWDRVSLHGNSMGGLLAVLTAASQGDRIESLILCSPSLPSPRSLGAVSLRAASRLGPFLIPGLGARILTQAYDRLTPEELYAQTERTVLAPAGNGYRQVVHDLGVENLRQGQQTTWRAPAFAAAASDLIRNLLRRDEIEGAVAAVTAPTLVVWGTEDQLVSRSVIDRAFGARPAWSRADLDGVGHVAQLEVPDRYLTTVRSWRTLTTNA